MSNILNILYRTHLLILYYQILSAYYFVVMNMNLLSVRLFRSLDIILLTLYLKQYLQVLHIIH